MREFGKSEIFRYKCPICGSVNKRMIPIILGRSLTAVFDDPKCIDKYILQCCNCGHQDTFVRPGIQRPVICECQQEAPIQNQKCYALNKCDLTQCPLYGTYTADKNSGYDDEQGSDDDNKGNGNGSNHGCGLPNCGCGADCNCKDHLGVYADSNLNNTELKIKVDRRDDPKFV